MQQFEVQSVKPLAAAARADSPVHGIDALIPGLPRQGREGAAVRIQRWYRHRQAERRVRFSPAVLMTTAKSSVVHTAVAWIILYTVLRRWSIWHLPLMALYKCYGGRECIAEALIGNHIPCLQAAQQDVRDFVLQRRHAAGVHTAEGIQGSASYADREALAAAAVAKAARLATEKQVSA